MDPERLNDWRWCFVVNSDSDNDANCNVENWNLITAKSETLQKVSLSRVVETKLKMGSLLLYPEDQKEGKTFSPADELVWSCGHICS